MLISKLFFKTLGPSNPFSHTRTVSTNHLNYLKSFIKLVAGTTIIFIFGKKKRRLHDPIKMRDQFLFIYYSRVVNEMAGTLSVSKFQVTVFTGKFESKWAKIIPSDRIYRITTYFGIHDWSAVISMNSVRQYWTAVHYL